MKFLNTAVPVMLLTLLTGCAPTSTAQWVKPGMTGEQKQHDFLECQYEASKAVAPIKSGIEAGWQKGDLRDQCMTVKGYYLKQIPR